MRYVFLLFFLIDSSICYSQILPAQHGVHYKKSGGAVSDTWDSSTKASCITLSNSNLTSLESNCTLSWNNVYGSTGVSSGIKEWEITIDAWDNQGGNNYDVMLGVSKLRTQNPSSAVGSGSYCYILQNGQKFTVTSGYTASHYGASYGEGDVIKISLNMDSNQITFYKNGVSQGVAFTVSNGTYYLVAAYVKNTHTQITITG